MMEPSAKFDPMTEVIKVLIEALRKQAFSVMLLLGAVAGLVTVMRTKEDNFDKKISTLEAKVDTMAARYLHCETNRARLTAKVEIMQRDLDALTRLKEKYEAR
jgi:outer membrane murein-binding lipoprotein Lpp